MNRVLFVVAYVFAIAAVSNAISCYSCSWDSNRNEDTEYCKTVYSTKTKTSLYKVGSQTECTQCKTRTVNNDNYQTVIRSCETECTEGPNNNDGYTYQISCCTTVNCNSVEFSTASRQVNLQETFYMVHLGVSLLLMAYMY